MLRTLLNSRFGTALYWLLPSLICAWLHRDGLNSWFQADDFAWLGANTEYHDLKTFWPALFRPAAQGTLRPLSERLFFFAFWHWFGWNALPYRIFVLVNQCLNLLLLTALVRRMSGSALAGFAAPVLWMANAAVVVPMAWTSGYNEVLCATFLLTALMLWIRFAETRKNVYYAAQVAVFLVGFGALELNLIYPALAAAWALFCRRSLLLWTAPLFAISAAYYKIHATLVPLQTSGPYLPHFDWAIARTLTEYWRLAFIPPFGFVTVQPTLAALLIASATAGLALCLYFETSRRNYAAPFFACWFLIALAPLLPFRDHLTHYYLTVPLAGLSAVAAIGLARSKILGSAIIALFLAVQLPLQAEAERWHLERSRAARALVVGVAQVHKWEPGKAILLTGVSTDLYGSTIADSPFRLIAGARVYLAPESLTEIGGLPSNLSPVSRFVLPPGPTRRALLENRLVVYDAAGTPLREVTGSYTRQALAGPEPGLPTRIEPGSPFMAYLLGPEWYPIEGAYRWMPRRATLRISGPRETGRKLVVTGFAVAESLRMQPLMLAVSVKGTALGTLRIGGSPFTCEFALPSSSMGAPSLEIALDVNRTFGTDRELGLVIETVEIR